MRLLPDEVTYSPGQEGSSRTRFLAGVAIAVVSMTGATGACGSAPSPEAAECGVLCEESFWASASEAEVKAQLERGPYLSAKAGELGVTPLHMAASHSGNPAVIALLLDAGADIGITSDANGATPLHMAADFNPEPAVSEILLDRGADFAAMNKSGATPLHVATALNSNPEVVVLLLNRGADPATLVGGSAGMLHTAAFNPEPEMVTLILEHGGDVKHRGQNGRTAGTWGRYCIHQQRGADAMPGSHVERGRDGDRPSGRVAALPVIPG